MKCSILAASLAAVGLMAFSAIGQSTTTTAYGSEDFSSYEAGAKVSELGTGPLGTWYAGEADKSEIDEDGNGKYLKLNTEGDVVSNAFTRAADINDALAHDTNVVISAKVTFVPSDELEDFSNAGDDLKFALYAYEQEIETKIVDGEVTNTLYSVATNLVVYHAFGNPKATTNEIVTLPAASTFTQSPDSPHPITTTMRKLGDNLYFKVAIDDPEGTSKVNYLYAPKGCTEAELDTGVPGEGDLEQRIWFQTVNGANQSDVAVKSLNFSGTGAINSLSAGYEAPAVEADVTVEWTADENLEAYKDKSLTKPITKASYTEKPGKMIYFSIAVGEEDNFHIEGSDLDIASDGLTASYTMSTNATLDIRAVANAAETFTVKVPAVANATVAVSSNDTVIANAPGTYTFPIPTAVKVVYTPEKDYKLNGDTEFTINNDTTTDLTDQAPTAEKLPTVATVITVAGGVTTTNKYTDLHEALVAGSAAGSVVELIANVDLAGKNWEPVANFAGTFDGKGFIISNLTITAESGEGVGLIKGMDTFTETAGAQIRNVTFENVSINAPNSTYVGTVGGSNMYHGLITNVTVCGTIQIIGYKYVGGIVGHAKYGHVIDCHVDGGDAATSFIGQASEKTAEGQVGGIWGMTGEGASYQLFDSSVKNVTLFGNERVGAIAGRIYGTKLVNCSAENVIVKNPEQKSTGMIAGTALSNGTSMLIDCEATNVTLEDGAGNPYDSVIIGSAAVNTAIGTDVEGDALVFGSSNFKFTAGTFTFADADALAGVTAQVATGYEVVDNGDGTYSIVLPPVANVTIGGETTPYTDLHAALVAGSVAGAVVELVDDVDLTGINWVPVPNFLGKFDGKGKTISNLKIDIEGGNAGLFGDNAWGKNHNGICNLVISNADVKATGNNVGVLAAKNGSDGGCVISNVTVCGNIKVIGSSYVGGLVGHNQYSHIIDCHVIGDGAATSVIGYGEVVDDVLKGSGQIGGLVGMTGEGNMHVWNCSVEKVSVKGSGLVGAIWGRMQDSSKMVGCSAKDVDVYCAADVETAEVKIGTLVGGFVGGGLAPVINCTATNVKLYTLDGTPIDDRWTGTVAEGKNVARGTDVAGDAFTFKFSNPKLTAGTFEVMSDAAVTSLAGWCQTGYAPIANGDGTYTITQVHTVTLKNGDAVVDTQIVADGQFATNVVLDVEGFKGWTNETYTAAFDFATTAITADTTLFAWIEAAPVVVYPEYIDLEDADMKKKYDDWARVYGADTDSSKGDAFLWNADPNGELPTLTIESIEIVDGDAKIVVAAEGVDLEKGINGVLYVSGCNALGGEWVTTVVDATADSFTGGKATFTVEGAQFMKAKIGFKAETPANPAN